MLRLQEKVSADPYFICFHASELESGKNLMALEQEEMMEQSLAHAGLDSPGR
jgi:hypothetical protein